MTRVAPPVFVSVVVSCALCPTCTCPKAREVGTKPTAAVVPVPLNGTFWGDPGALSVKVMFAESAPVAEGVKVTLTEQFAPAASVEPQVLAEIVKALAFVPVIEIDVRFSVALPVLVTVVESGAEVVDTGTEPKDRLVGEKLIPA